MNIDKKINDKISVVDSERKPIKGVVKILDDNGNVIAKRENIVVIDGRKIIFDLFYRLITTSTETDVTESGKIFSINFNYLTTPILSNPSLQYDQVTPNGTSSDLISADLTRTNIVKNDNDLCLEITYTLTSESGTKFNNLFLTYRSGSLSENKLFSRVAIDDVFLSAGAAYTIQYNIYF